MLHIKKYEGLLDRFKKVDLYHLQLNIFRKLTESGKYTSVSNNLVIKNVTSEDDYTTITDTVSIYLRSSAIIISIKRTCKIFATNKEINTSELTISMNFRGELDNVSNKCIEIINNAYDKFCKENKTDTDIKIKTHKKELAEKVEKVRANKELEEKSKSKLKEYYSDFYERVDIDKIKDYLYDISDILGEYTISKIEALTVGYRITWENVDILNFKKSLKVKDFTDFKNSYQLLELIKEFAQIIKSEFDIDVNFDHTGKSSNLVLTISEDLPIELQNIAKAIAYTRGRPRRA